MMVHFLKTLNVTTHISCQFYTGMENSRHIVCKMKESKTVFHLYQPGVREVGMLKKSNMEQKVLVAFRKRTQEFWRADTLRKISERWQALRFVCSPSILATVPLRIAMTENLDVRGRR